MHKILWKLLCWECPQFSGKGPSMKWVCSPKSYNPLANWPWLRVSPQSSLYVIYFLILTAWQWLMSFTCIPVQIEPNKSPLRKRLLALLLWEIGHLSSQADHVLVDLLASVADGVPCRQSSPTISYFKLLTFLSLHFFSLFPHHINVNVDVCVWLNQITVRNFEFFFFLLFLAWALAAVPSAADSFGSETLCYWHCL